MVLDCQKKGKRLLTKWLNFNLRLCWQFCFLSHALGNKKSKGGKQGVKVRKREREEGGEEGGEEKRRRPVKFHRDKQRQKLRETLTELNSHFSCAWASHSLSLCSVRKLIPYNTVPFLLNQSESVSITYNQKNCHYFI